MGGLRRLYQAPLAPAVLFGLLSLGAAALVVSGAGAGPWLAWFALGASAGYSISGSV